MYSTLLLMLHTFSGRLFLVLVYILFNIIIPAQYNCTIPTSFSAELWSISILLVPILCEAKFSTQLQQWMYVTSYVHSRRIDLYFFGLQILEIYSCRQMCFNMNNCTAFNVYLQDCFKSTQLWKQLPPFVSVYRGVYLEVNLLLTLSRFFCEK